MEHKLVELARSVMDQPDTLPFLKRQVHRPDEAYDRSGMICSGEQTMAFHMIGTDQGSMLCAIIEAIGANSAVELDLASSGVRLVARGSSPRDPAEAWSYRIPLDSQPRIVIIGGGHVGLALSRTMHQLGFLVMQYDHREGLNTMVTNAWAHEQQVVDFAQIDRFVPDDPDVYITLVSHGYRTDEIALRRLIRRRWKYLGMLGSKAKVEAMFANMRADGFSEEVLARVHAPIGLPVNSRTAEEIAISIAAQIIEVKNRE